MKSIIHRRSNFEWVCLDGCNLRFGNECFGIIENPLNKIELVIEIGMNPHPLICSSFSNFVGEHTMRNLMLMEWNKRSLLYFFMAGDIEYKRSKVWLNYFCKNTVSMAEWVQKKEGVVSFYCVNVWKLWTVFLTKTKIINDTNNITKKI